MRAVRFHVSIPGYLIAKSLGRVTDWALFGAAGGVKLEELPAPALPGPSWVGLEVLQSGICGSDISNVTYAASPSMEPFGSFPAVLGHEVLARVAETGPHVRGLEVGQRVVVDPMISCTTRGFGAADDCRSCDEGLHSTCEQAGEEGPAREDGSRLGRGLTIGYHGDLPGGWAERMVAHESQLFPVPDAIPDRRAVLTEPVSIGLHGALRSPPHPDEPVLVIGSGPIALGTIWALRALGFDGFLLGQTKRRHEAELARAFGASDVVSPGLEARNALVDTGAVAYQPIVGPEVFERGGFPLIFDCVGSAGSLSQALSFAAPRGRLVMLGCAGRTTLDLTAMWARELDLKGYVGYGLERWRGGTRHTMAIAHELMEETGTPLEKMVTHVFPLAQFRTALGAAANHRASGAVKVVLEP